MKVLGVLVVVVFGTVSCNPTFGLDGAFGLIGGAAGAGSGLLGGVLSSVGGVVDDVLGEVKDVTHDIPVAGGISGSVLGGADGHGGVTGLIHLLLGCAGHVKDVQKHLGHIHGAPEGLEGLLSSVLKLINSLGGIKKIIGASPTDLPKGALEKLKSLPKLLHELIGQLTSLKKKELQKVGLDKKVPELIKTFTAIKDKLPELLKGQGGGSPGDVAGLPDKLKKLKSGCDKLFKNTEFKENLPSNLKDLPKHLADLENNPKDIAKKGPKLSKKLSALSAFLEKLTEKKHVKLPVDVDELKGQISLVVKVCGSASKGSQHSDGDSKGENSSESEESSNESESSED